MKAFIYFLSFLFAYFATPANSQVGNRCQQDSDCYDGLICESELCVCRPHYIQSGSYCFPEAHYGEVCWFLEQCIDHRQSCSNTTYGSRRCLCDTYHEYEDSVEQCMPKKNLTALLEEKYKTFDDISSEAKSTFLGIMIVGLAVTVIGFFCLIVASFYCCKIHTSDKKLAKDVNKLIVLKGGKPDPNCFSTRKTHSQRRKQLTDASIGPVIQAEMIIV